MLIDNDMSHSDNGDLLVNVGACDDAPQHAYNDPNKIRWRSWSSASWASRHSDKETQQNLFFLAEFSCLIDWFLTHLLATKNVWESSLLSFKLFHSVFCSHSPKMICFARDLLFSIDNHLMQNKWACNNDPLICRMRCFCCKIQCTPNFAPSQMQSGLSFGDAIPFRQHGCWVLNKFAKQNILEKQTLVCITQHEPCDVTCALCKCSKGCAHFKQLRHFTNKSIGSFISWTLECEGWGLGGWQIPPFVVQQSQIGGNSTLAICPYCPPYSGIFESCRIR